MATKMASISDSVKVESSAVMADVMADGLTDEKGSSNGQALTVGSLSDETKKKAEELKEKANEFFKSGWCYFKA